MAVGPPDRPELIDPSARPTAARPTASLRAATRARRRPGEQNRDGRFARDPSTGHAAREPGVVPGRQCGSPTSRRRDLLLATRRASGNRGRAPARTRREGARGGSGARRRSSAGTNLTAGRSLGRSRLRCRPAMALRKPSATSTSALGLERTRHHGATTITLLLRPGGATVAVTGAVADADSFASPNRRPLSERRDSSWIERSPPAVGRTRVRKLRVFETTEPWASAGCCSAVKASAGANRARACRLTRRRLTPRRREDAFSRRSARVLLGRSIGKGIAEAKPAGRAVNSRRRAVNSRRREVCGKRSPVSSGLDTPVSICIHR
jgi:hypothetical protein